jgi:polysaccharide pyruvyl transferase WcaK-like protein
MGPFGYGNIADEVLIDAMIANLNRREPDWQFVGFSLDPRDTADRHGIPSHPVSHVSPGGDARGVGRVLARWRSSGSPALRRLERVVRRGPAELGLVLRARRAAGEIDAMIMCGSGQIQDYWAGGGPFSYPYTMLRWVMLSKVRRIPFLVVSVGAGPVHSRLSARFFRWALARTDYRSYRDQWSKEFVRTVVGFDRDDPVVADLAFSPLLDIASGPRAAEGQIGDRVVGIGPMGYFREGSWPEGDDVRWHRFRDEIATVVATLIDRGDRVMFLKGEGIHDQPVVDEIRTEVARRGVDLSASMVDAPVTTVAELAEAIGRCAAVVAARYHNVLFSYLVDRPVVGISYQEKTDALMQRYGEDRWCIEIGAVTAEAVLSALDDVITRDRSARATITAEQRRLLEAQYDTVREIIATSAASRSR